MLPFLRATEPALVPLEGGIHQPLLGRFWMTAAGNACAAVVVDVRSPAMSARVSRLGASFVMATALSVPLLMQHATAASALTTACAPNSDISSSGCGNTGIGNSGSGNHGNGNSGSDNVGDANSGSGNVGTGNSGCNNLGIANSGGGNVGVANSGGTKCPQVTKKTPETTVVTTVTEVPRTEVPGAEPGVVVESKTLPLTGSKTTGPLTLAVGFLLAGAVAIGVAGRRRMASATLRARSSEGPAPLSESLGRLLSGRGPKSL